MRTDLRLPWHVLVEDVLGQWREGFLSAWLERRWQFTTRCACAEWLQRRGTLQGVSHWQLHGLVPQLEELRFQVERHTALGLIRRQERAEGRTPQTLLPKLTAAQRRELDARMGDFDAIVNEHVVNVPADVRQLTRRCVAEQLGVHTGLRSISDALDDVLAHLVGGDDRTGARGVPGGGRGAADSVSRSGVESAVQRLYVWFGFARPHVLWARSPVHAEVIADVLADLCATLMADPAGFPELEVDLVWARHDGRLDAVTRELVTAAAWHVTDSPEPAQALLPVVGHLVDLEARALLALAGRLGLQGTQLAEDLRRGQRRFTAPTDGRTAARGRLVPSVARSIGRQLHPRRARALPSDPWVGPGVFEELEQRGPDDLSGLSEVLTLRRELFSWSGTRGVVILVENPVDVHLDPAGLLHHESGPAAHWPDGWGVHFWHGTEVPGDLVEHGWSVSRILGEENLEVRRCAIERIGWDRFVMEAGLRPVGWPADDPANPGFELRLYDVPAGVVDQVHLRLLLCTNASVERDGTRRRFGLMVPARFVDPVAAAAWTFGLSRAQYARLQAAT